MDKTALLSCELFLLDMDGTLYLGDEVFPGAVGFIPHARAHGPPLHLPDEQLLPRR